MFPSLYGLMDVWLGRDKKRRVGLHLMVKLALYKLWRKRSASELPSEYGAILGCCLSGFKKANGKPDKGLNRLFCIIMLESMYMIWKLRCERTIAWCC